VNIDRRSVIRIIKILEAGGYLERNPRYNQNGRKSNGYQLSEAVMVSKTEGVTPPSPPSDTPVTRVVTPQSPKSLIESPKNQKPYEHKGARTAGFENYSDAEMQRQFVKITGMLTFPSKSREQDLTRLRAIAKANHGDAVRYCARFFQEWMRRGYAKSNTAWLDWAVAGEIPTPRTRRNARRKEQENGNTSGPIEYSQADIAFADALIAAHTE
jgi:hypothetical protein